MHISKNIGTDDKAKNAIALGRVTYPCGQKTTPIEFVSSKFSIGLAREASGLTYPDIMQTLRTEDSQELAQLEVNKLDAEIKAGRKTC